MGIYQTSDPNEDAYLSSSGNNAATAAKTVGDIMSSMKPATGAGTPWGRAYCEWPMKYCWPGACWGNKIPTNAVVTRVDIEIYRHETTLNCINCDIVGLANPPATNDAATVWADITNAQATAPPTPPAPPAGSVNWRLQQNVNVCSSADNMIRLAYIGATEPAVGHVQSAINAQRSWWAIGILFNNQAQDANPHRLDKRTEEYGVSPPKLKITF